MVRLAIAALMLVIAAPAMGGSPIKRGEKQMNLTADDLVWYRDENRLVATGNARLIRSGVELRANVLTAYTRKNANGTGCQLF